MRFARGAGPEMREDPVDLRALGDAHDGPTTSACGLLGPRQQLQAQKEPKRGAAELLGQPGGLVLFGLRVQRPCRTPVAVSDLWRAIRRLTMMVGIALQGGADGVRRSAQARHFTARAETDMKRVLIYAGLVGCGAMFLNARHSDAQALDGGCPSVSNDFCATVDLSEICGPGCNVQIMGDRQTDG